MHHVGPEQISDLYAFEVERKYAEPLRIKDIYYRYFAPHLLDTRPDWDNFSEDVYYLNSSAADYKAFELKRTKKIGMSALEIVAHQSYSNCKETCYSLGKCFQFRFRNGICSISHKLKHGKPVKRRESESERSMSGWNMKKIQTWIRKHEPCGEHIDWPVRDS